MSRRALLLLAALTFFASAGAIAQSGFRVTHAIDRTTPTHVEVSGTVTNETRAEALDVSVTVEALNERGKAAARGIAYVSGRLPAGETAKFTAKIPVVAGVNGYRASVTSFRFVQSIQGP